MKATIVFDLDDHQDKKEHFKCIKANDMFCALYDIRSIKRNIEKNEDLTEEQDQLLEKVFKKIFDIYEENNININEME